MTQDTSNREKVLVAAREGRVSRARIATLGELAAVAGGEVLGDAGLSIERVSALGAAKTGSITFLAAERYRAQLDDTAASAVILPPAMAEVTSLPRLTHDNPYLAFARVAEYLHPSPQPTGRIAASAAVAADAVLGERVQVDAGATVESGVAVGDDVWIGPGCVIQTGASIGGASRLMANVTIYPETRIGQRARVHAGVVLGSDGFGYARGDSGWYKVPQLGIVRIGDDVEIGANTTVDRGALGDTVIENGVKLDNLVHVAHNVSIGAHSAVAACVGIAGSTRIGRHCSIGGAAGVAGHLEIADGVVITAMSWVIHSIREPGVYSSGTPMAPNREWRRNAARFNQLDRMARRLQRLERELQRLWPGKREDQ